MSGRWITFTASLNVLNASRFRQWATAARAKLFFATHRKIHVRVKMSLINSPDFWIQSVASLFAIVNIYLLAHGSIKLGCQIGLVGQLIFIWIFIDAKQYPLIATDAILFGIYVKKLYELRNTTYRRIQL
jgi:nicotinamide riboside transporter PnuC